MWAHVSSEKLNIFLVYLRHGETQPTATKADNAFINIQHFAPFSFVALPFLSFLFLVLLGFFPVFFMSFCFFIFTSIATGPLFHTVQPEHCEQFRDWTPGWLPRVARIYSSAAVCTTSYLTEES